MRTNPLNVPGKRPVSARHAAIPPGSVSPARRGGGGGHEELLFALSAGGFVVGGILAGVLLFGGLYVLYQGFQGLR